MIHGALSAQSATVAGDSRMGSVQEHRANVVIQASYAILLRPLRDKALQARPVRQKLFSLHEGAHWRWPARSDRQVAKPCRTSRDYISYHGRPEAD